MLHEEPNRVMVWYISKGMRRGMLYRARRSSLTSYSEISRYIAEREKKIKPLHRQYKGIQTDAKRQAPPPPPPARPQFGTPITGSPRRRRSRQHGPPNRSAPPHALAPQRVSSRGSTRVAAMADCKVGPPAPIRPLSPLIPRIHLGFTGFFAAASVANSLPRFRGTDGLCQLRG